MDISPQRVRTAEFRTVKRGLDPDEVREFFGAFFELRIEQWRGYMRIDTPPAEVAAVMAKLFRASSWSMRRRLMSGNPVAFARLLRP